MLNREIKVKCYQYSGGLKCIVSSLLFCEQGLALYYCSVTVLPVTDVETSKTADSPFIIVAVVKHPHDDAGSYGDEDEQE